MRSRVVLGMMIALCVMSVRAQDILVERIQGDVQVRHSVHEEWVKVKVGDLLKPNDSMRTGRKGSATLKFSAPVQKKLELPAEVILEMTDLRDLSQEELMLKLTMERVRASSYEWKSDELKIPDVTSVHGTDRASSEGLPVNGAAGMLLMNGTRVLYQNGFYATCALRTLDVLRRYPQLRAQFEHRLFLAQTLEKARLNGEALSEYAQMLTSEDLTQEQRNAVRANMERLREK